MITFLDAFLKIHHSSSSKDSFISHSVARLYTKLSISFGLAPRCNSNQASAELTHLGGSY
ncbi:hypothetical protein IJL65_04260 [bacterium]|nr:hypothetical protein [bacterium]